MRYFLNSMITVFLLSSLVLDAQTDLSIRRKDFKNSKPGFEEAWKHVANGDAYYGEKVSGTMMHIMNICWLLYIIVQMPS